VFDWDAEWWRRMPPPPGDVQLTNEVRTSLGWTSAIAARESEIMAMAREVPFFSRSAIGMVSPTVDAGLNSNSLPFGVILYAEGSTAHPLDQEWNRALSFPGPGAQIPVVVRRGTFAFSGSTTSSSGSATSSSGSATPSSGWKPPGSYACFATWRGGTSRGWLTARHVARAVPPNLVVDMAADCVDAALVNLPNRTPAQPVPVAISTASPAAQLPVTLDFKPGAPIPTVVLDVSNTLGVNDPKFPLRISTQAAGKSGNSGSLISENGLPFGMYLGHFTPAKNPSTSSGVGLVLSQLQTLVDLEVFR
jgi:hypothetical protein